MICFGQLVYGSGISMKISVCLVFVSLLLLTACRGPESLEPVVTSQVSITPLGETGQLLTPSPVDQKPLGGAYPEPEVTMPSQSPQSTSVATENEAYPPPGSTSVTGGSDAYPPPGTLATTTGQELGNFNQPYPAPETDIPLGSTGTSQSQGISGQTAVSTPTTTLIPTSNPTITSISTATPTPTAPMGLVRTELRASDPSEFSLVSGELQLVMFFAHWSPLSKSMAPVMNALEEKYQDRITFFYLDIDDPSNNFYKYLLGDRLPPVFFLIDSQGIVLNEWQGFVMPEEFEAAFASVVITP